MDSRDMRLSNVAVVLMLACGCSVFTAPDVQLAKLEHLEVPASVPAGEVFQIHFWYELKSCQTFSRMDVTQTYDGIVASVLVRNTDCSLSGDTGLILAYVTIDVQTPRAPQFSVVLRQDGPDIVASVSDH